VVLAAGLLFAAPAPAQPFAWQTATPESQGMSSSKLDALKDSLAAHKTVGFLVLRNDQIVCEWYAPGHSATRGHYTASMAKALVGGLSLAVAMGDGRIGLDDKVAKYIPQWQSDPRKAQITLRQLGSHTSGLEDAEADGLPHDKLTGWKGDFWKRLQPPNDPFTVSRDRAPTLFDPGEKLQYSNPGIAMLTFAVTAALKDAPVKDVRTLLRDRVMRPIGVPDGEWSVGYGQTFTVDGLPLVGSWGGGNYTARAAVRVGRLLQRGGDWDGQQLLSKEAVRQSTMDAGTPGHGGIGWWTNTEGRYAKVPRDAFWAAGAGHQILLVVPSLRLVALRNGATLAPTARGPAESHEPVRKLLFEPLVDAILGEGPSAAGAAPYPPSKLITRLEWAPKETIVRQAKGSDNWPMTWADDDHLYTTYGDGWGFDPRVPEKLSLGFARVEGIPADFKGVNIRTSTLEGKGDGPKGKKASGILMVDGVLYLLVRNAGNTQLAWSADRGRTWTWSDWKFTTSFGCPTFLNFGRNYAGARDAYVYVFSHDSDSAYQPADRIVLARVPKGRIRERDAYEFYKGPGTDNNPVWTKDVAERGAVFNNPGKCYRTSVSYNAGLKRYLLCHAGDDGPKVQAGLGIYDAPEPWGPWTTVYHAPKWDVGPGETACLPTKWMSPDGKTLHLVFAGDDSFAVRRATLTTARGE
jgi:CubicO group peptidase (beta-lactamase class C family)